MSVSQPSVQMYRVKTFSSDDPLNPQDNQLSRTATMNGANTNHTATTQTRIQEMCNPQDDSTGNNVLKVVPKTGFHSRRRRTHLL